MKKKILLIEDDTFIRDLYQRQLEQANFKVITAGDGEAAVEKLKEKPNLILLDILMPKKAGLDFLREIKNDSSYKSIPVILITNIGQDEVIKNAFELGASGYLIKSSTTPSDIIDHVQEFLNHRNHS